MSLPSSFSKTKGSIRETTICVMSAGEPANPAIGKTLAPLILNLSPSPLRWETHSRSHLGLFFLFGLIVRFHQIRNPGMRRSGEKVVPGELGPEALAWSYSTRTVLVSVSIPDSSSISEALNGTTSCQQTPHPLKGEAPVVRQCTKISVAVLPVVPIGMASSPTRHWPRQLYCAQAGSQER